MTDVEPPVFQVLNSRSFGALVDPFVQEPLHKGAWLMGQIHNHGQVLHLGGQGQSEQGRNDQGRKFFQKGRTRVSCGVLQVGIQVQVP